MSSVTAVPLQPIQKGSVRRLWLAVILIIAAALALAWLGLRPFGHTKSGVVYQIIKAGSDKHPGREDYALIGYRGQLPSGKPFDENKQTPMDLTQMVPGFAEAVTLIGEGGQIRAWIPADQAYGDQARGDVIPANSPLIFDITLFESRTRDEVMEMQRQMQMQQMLQQQMQGGGGPGGAPIEGLEGLPTQ